MKQIDNAIGKAVKYFDYLGFERYGSIVAIEPYPMDPNQLYIYISDEEPEFNIHQMEGTGIKYAEIRPSGEVYLDVD